MGALLRVLLSLALCTALIHDVKGLNCYKCVNVNQKFLGIFDEDTNSGCGDDDVSGVDTMTCNSGESCVFIKGEADYGFGSTAVSVRGCLDVGDTNVFSTNCRSASTDDIAGLSIVTKLLAGIDSIDADLCYCNTDLCVAQECDGGVLFGNYCMQVWLMVILIVIAVVLVSGFCCCCCCCCCFKPCRTPKRPAVIMQQNMAQPAVISVPTTSQNTTAYTSDAGSGYSYNATGAMDNKYGSPFPNDKF